MCFAILHKFSGNGFRKMKTQPLGLRYVEYLNPNEHVYIGFIFKYDLLSLAKYTATNVEQTVKINSATRLVRLGFWLDWKQRSLDVTLKDTISKWIVIIWTNIFTLIVLITTLASGLSCLPQVYIFIFFKGHTWGRLKSWLTEVCCSKQQRWGW